MNINTEIVKNYSKWAGWAEKRWNGKGEDVFQDTLILLWEKILHKEAHFTDLSALSTWVWETIMKKGKDTDQGRKKINQNSTSLEAKQGKGFQPMAGKEEEERDMGDVWKNAMVSHTLTGRIRAQVDCEDLPLFLKEDFIC